MQESSKEFLSLKEAASEGRVVRQAIFLAIKSGHLKGEKKNIRGRLQWTVLKEDLDSYRRNKYSRDKRVVDGQKLFDLEEGRYSVLHCAKILASSLGRPYHAYRLYYLLRIGELRGEKKGSAWVICKQELVDLFKREMAGFEDQQMKFA